MGTFSQRSGVFWVAFCASVTGVMAERLDSDLIGVVVAAVCIGVLSIVIIAFMAYCCFRRIEYDRKSVLVRKDSESVSTGIAPRWAPGMVPNGRPVYSVPAEPYMYAVPANYYLGHYAPKFLDADQLHYMRPYQYTQEMGEGEEDEEEHSRRAQEYQEYLRQREIHLRHYEEHKRQRDEHTRQHEEHMRPQDEHLRQRDGQVLLHGEQVLQRGEQVLQRGEQVLQRGEQVLQRDGLVRQHEEQRQVLEQTNVTKVTHLEAAASRQVEAAASHHVEATGPSLAEGAATRYIEAAASRHLEASASRHVEAATSRHVEAATSRHVEAATSRHVEAAATRQVEAAASLQVDTSASQVEGQASSDFTASSVNYRVIRKHHSHEKLPEWFTKDYDENEKSMDVGDEGSRGSSPGSARRLALEAEPGTPLQAVRAQVSPRNSVLDSDELLHVSRDFTIVDYVDHDQPRSTSLSYRVEDNSHGYRITTHTTTTNANATAFRGQRLMADTSHASGGSTYVPPASTSTPRAPPEVMEDLEENYRMRRSGDGSLDKLPSSSERPKADIRF